ncbi:prolactin-releasing peptide receptor-like [Ptychodera flava]|uniref:prolactin-releasing peptide receptor-like n=1 Tax=Ptychodera flava TaxID=63121 RepID=UPI00396A04D5
MEMGDNLNQTNPAMSNDSYWDRLHAEIIAYMLNRSEKEGRYWENPPDPDPSPSAEPFYDSSNLQLDSGWQTALICAFSFNIALSILGNLIVLIVLSYGKTKSDLNIFLINLALADLTTAIFCMPFTFSTIMYGHWIFGTGMCPTVIFLQQVAVIVSIFTLTAIGIDRYFAVMYPLKVRVTKHRSKIILAVIFVIAVSLAVVQAVYARARRIAQDETFIYFCDEWQTYSQAAMAYEIFIVLTTYFVPLVVLLYTYSRIAIKLWGRRMPGNADTSRDKSHANSKKKIIKMLIVVVFMFALCWLPLHIFNLIVKFHPYFYIDHDPKYQDTLRKINCGVLWLAMSNSFMNPLIYSFFNDVFRADMKGIFCHCNRYEQRKRTTAFFTSTTPSRSRSTSSTSTTALTTLRLARVSLPKVT